MNLPEIDRSIELLKKVVKDSHLDRQKHLDLSLVMATDRARYQEALRTVRLAVKDGHLSEDELKKRLGLV